MPRYHGSRLWASVLAASLLLIILASSTAGESLGPAWTSTSIYPTTIGLGSCVTNSDFGYLYCMAGSTGNGYTSQTEYSSFSTTSGVGTWAPATGYPLAVAGHDCVVYTVYIYCVGGYVGISQTSAVYYAQMTSNGLGTWTSGTAYPLSVAVPSCNVYLGYVDCVGGYNGTRYINNTFSSQLTKGGGVGAWSSVTAYPIKVGSLSCVTYSGYLYCVGGQGNSINYNNVYFAPLTSNGAIGSWTQTTPYPTTIYSQSCSVVVSYIYCVGGSTGKGDTVATNYAPLSATGVGSWVSSTSYPSPVSQLSCVPFSSALYCIGGVLSGAISSPVYYDSVSAIPPVTVTATTTTTSTATSTATSTVTSTATSTQTSVVTQSVTTTATSTSVFFSTISRTTSVTTTASIFSLTTSTATSFVTITSPPTTVTSTIGQGQGGSAPFRLDLVSVAAGLVLGVLVAVVVQRVRRGRAAGQEGSEPEADDFV